MEYDATFHTERIERAQRAIDAYQQTSDTDSAIRDLLADLMHWCADNGFDPERETQMALTHFNCECAPDDIEENWREVQQG